VNYNIDKTALQHFYEPYLTCFCIIYSHISAERTFLSGKNQPLLIIQAKTGLCHLAKTGLFVSDYRCPARLAPREPGKLSYEVQHLKNK